MRNVKVVSRLNIKGMSLIELLVASAVLAIILMSSLSISQQMFKSQVTAEAGQELTSLLYEVSGILNNQSLCTNAMLGTPSIEDQPVTLKPTITSGATYGKLDFTTVLLKNITNVGGLNRSAEVQFIGVKRSDVWGSKAFVESAKLYYSVDGTNNIVRCITVANDAAANCAALGGVWDGASCDFCASLGGTVLTDGSCQLSGTTTYAWQLGPWAACAAGTQSRSVDCIDMLTSATVASANCAPPVPPATQSCPVYNWLVGAWSPLACGGAPSQTRSVICIDTITSVPAPGGDSDCTTPKPSTSQSCGTCTIAAGTSWTSGTETCHSDSTLVIFEGGSGSVSDTGSPTTGNATFNCTGGSLSGPTGASCTSTIVPPVMCYCTSRTTYPCVSYAPNFGTEAYAVGDSSGDITYPSSCQDMTYFNSSSGLSLSPTACEGNFEADSANLKVDLYGCHL